ncbi:hypothetical protein [Geminocystis sp. GBBB08]|uniref:hypothetical protein n=1 Tax=Geminocystis sp. GBBB08 TaxID=2604140 RepID=UPI0027E28274|nr:hypothetical protein [Geminocystis sp. GBBB08]
MSSSQRISQRRKEMLGLLELPDFRLLDSTGNRLNISQIGLPLISKQILLSQLQSGGFDPQLVNLKLGNDSEEFGVVEWRGMNLSKGYVGTKISTLDPNSYDAWGVTNNFSEYRELALLAIAHLARGNSPIVVGGSDALAVPSLYLEAGATAVVQDKSGAANWAIFDHVLGREPREKLTGVIKADGTKYPKSTNVLSPEDWPIPSLEVIKQCFGQYHCWTVPINNEDFSPVGSILFDIGCDRTCDFCQTPTYGTGYKRMTPKTALVWAAALKEAGARSIISGSDQFLGRVLFPEGKQEVLDILNGLRELEMPISWLNGIELRKATRGGGNNKYDADLTPDEEIVEAVWGWDGKVGCIHAYIPAERPIVGRESYKKLLPWNHHCEMMKAIVRSGVPNIDYGVIIGFPDDNNESLLYLEEAVSELFQELKTINPKLILGCGVMCIAPLPGTPQDYSIREKNLLRFEDPAIFGNVIMSSSDTLHLSYEEVADWQRRLWNLSSKSTVISAEPLTKSVSFSKVLANFGKFFKQLL